MEPRQLLSPTKPRPFFGLTTSSRTRLGASMFGHGNVDAKCIARLTDVGALDGEEYVTAAGELVDSNTPERTSTQRYS